MIEMNIVLESDLANLAKAREFIATGARQAGATESDITKIEISCDEWCANIIEHSMGSDVRHTFSIRCEKLNEKFCVTFENQGDRFNPIEQENVDLDDYYCDAKERGLGIYIMKEMMDEIHYEYLDPGVNKLTLVKILGR
jgi:serine/threonine-protein kinase RsbW